MNGDMVLESWLDELYDTLACLNDEVYELTKIAREQLALLKMFVEQQQRNLEEHKLVLH